MPHKGSGFSYQTLAKTPLNGREILITYLYSWLIYPVILFAPMVLGISEVWFKIGLPESWQIPYICLAILWFVVWIWKLADWHEAQCRP